MEGNFGIGDNCVTFELDDLLVGEVEFSNLDELEEMQLPLTGKNPMCLVTDLWKCLYYNDTNFKIMVVPKIQWKKLKIPEKQKIFGLYVEPWKTLFVVKSNLRYNTLKEVREILTSTAPLVVLTKNSEGSWKVKMEKLEDVQRDLDK